ncbi:hypothetical protein QLQ12_36570 [Actinoplanes sp. NEAU-A12]|uniref:LysM domain-containing protein n=1 Tax=Actinoplanes sandaracinus TaxID=3045177 RepID=A0ABT6WWX9_9ACTN|nr:hypothetical protein [Actinoplanes sandaracinus]MDI6104121.1 hypothetical protein [Actinoplanes sandaracinus]
MSSYDERSRYRDVPVYQVPDHRGRTVSVVAVPPPPEQAVAGVHLLRQGERPDHLAAQYLDDPAGFWRLAEANDAMQAEWLTERREITVPVRRS